MLDINVTGIQEAIDRINIFELLLKAKMDEIIERLMNEGFEVASYAYATANYAGTKDITLNVPQWDGDRMVLTAEGKTIAFIEFGTGTVYERYPSKMPGDGGGAYKTLGMSHRGRFGKGKGSNPPWVYVGDPGDIGYVIGRKKYGKAVVQTIGNPPARGMYNAALTVASKRRATEIAKEVFKE